MAISNCINKMVNKMTMLMVVAIMMPLVLGQTVKIYPSDDAYVVDDSNSKNYDYRNTNFNGDNLRIGKDINYGIQRSYLKFDLTGLTDLSNAKLSIDPLGTPEGSPTIEVHYVSDDSWTESSIKWNYVPSYSPTIVDSVLANSPDRTEFDVSSIINEGDKILSIVLKSSDESRQNYLQSPSKDYNDIEYRPYIEFGGANCNTDADSDCNGCVEMGELLPFISEWKSGNANMSELLQSISMWKTGVGC